MENIVKEIIARVEAMAEKEHILVAIDGSCTSGKSTLARMLEERLDCNLFHVDDFFLRPEQRTKARLEEVGGNVDYERFCREVLMPLKGGEPVCYRPFDCRTGLLAEPVTAQPKHINIVEGSYSQHPYFGDIYDLKVFLTVSQEVRTQRINRRPPMLQKKFFDTWIPMEQRYFETFSVMKKADLVVMPRDNQ